jgi:trimeric autotransporter adhesin
MIKRLSRLAVVSLLALLVLLAMEPNALAYWITNGASGANTAATASLSAPGVTVTPSPGSATVAWTAVSGTGGTPIYYVQRTDTSTGTSTAACGTSASDPITVRSCTDRPVPAGTFRYTVYATAAQWTSQGSSGTVTIVNPTPARLVFTTQPGNASAGQALAPQPVVSVEDANGLVVTANTSAITLSLTTANGASLVCLPSSNAATAVAGVATFAGCSVQQAGSYTLTATGAGFTAVSASFVVSPGPAAKLVFTTQPGNAYAGTSFSTPPVVAVEDAYGNVVTSSSAPVALQLTPTSGGLTCPARNATAGVATFSGCRVATARAGLPTVTSTAFTVYNPPSKLVWSNISSGCLLLTGTTSAVVGWVCDNTNLVAAITLVDASGNAVPNLTGADLSVSVTITSGVGTVAPTTLTIPPGASVTTASTTLTPTFTSRSTATTFQAGSGTYTVATAQLLS